MLNTALREHYMYILRTPLAFSISLLDFVCILLYLQFNLKLLRQRFPFFLLILLLLNFFFFFLLLILLKYSLLGYLVQDLSMLNRDPSRVLYISGHALDSTLQPENGVAIKPWMGEPEDTALLDLIPFLECKLLSIFMYGIFVM